MTYLHLVSVYARFVRAGLARNRPVAFEATAKLEEVKLIMPPEVSAALGLYMPGGFSNYICDAQSPGLVEKIPDLQGSVIHFADGTSFGKFAGRIERNAKPIPIYPDFTRTLGNSNDAEHGALFESLRKLHRTSRG